MSNMLWEETELYMYSSIINVNEEEMKNNSKDNIETNNINNNNNDNNNNDK